MCNTCGCKSAETFEAPRISSYYDCEKGRHRWKENWRGTNYYPTQTEYGDNIIIEENQYTCKDCGIYKTSRNTYDFKEASFEEPKTYHMTYGSKKGKLVPIYDEKMERFLEESNAPTYHRTFLGDVLRGYGAEEGKVRTMSGKPHTPRKLRKDQNIKPEEARMRKQMKAEEYKHCDGCEEVRSIEEFSLSNDPEQTLTEGEVCDYCFGDFYDAESFEAQSKGKSKCSKHYWDLAVRRNPISGERQFFNQCLLCGKKNFSRGGSAMSDRGFFAESKTTKSSNDFIEVGKIATLTRRNDSYTGKILHIWETKQFTYMNVAFPLRPRDIEMNEEEIKSNNPYLYNFPIWLVNSNDRPKQTHWGMTLRQRHGEDGWERVSSVKHSYERTDFSIRKGQFRGSLGGVYFTCNLKTKPFNAEGFSAESPFSSDAFNEGRSAGITMFIPEGDAEDYYSNLDTEYMIFYGLSPEDLAKDIDGNSKRYLQFVAGWDDGWNYATLLHEGVLTDDSDSEGDLEDLDYEMAGEWIYKDFPEGLQEYVASPKELGAEIAVMGGILALGLGYFVFKDKIGFKGETFRATESCSEDEDCPDGKVCVDGKCLPICVDDGDCASWRECRDDLHPTEKVCGEDKTDSTENPFSDFIKREENQVDEPTEPNATEGDTYSTTTKALIGVGIVGAIGFGIKVLGGMQDKGDE